MSKNYVVYRMNFLDRKVYPVNELLRFYYDKTKSCFVLDLEKNHKGRGLYLKVDESSLSSTLNNKNLIKKLGKDAVEQLKVYLSLNNKEE